MVVRIDGARGERIPPSQPPGDGRAQVLRAPDWGVAADLPKVLLEGLRDKRGRCLLGLPKAQADGRCGAPGASAGLEALHALERIGMKLG